MNKNVIIAALAALLIGIGIGFSMAQVSRADVVEPSSEATSVSQDDAEQSQQSNQAAASTDNTASSSNNAATSSDSSVAPSSNAATTNNAASSGNAASSSNAASADNAAAPSAQGAGVVVEESGTYTSKDEVAAYIHEFGHLPSNYISKTEARKAGWVANKGNLDEVLPGMSIGGSEFYNDEDLLPDAPGRTWTECDINYEGGYRGAERIVFSNDGLIFYTNDHYKSFEQLY